jgi:hypothetical protein
MDFVTTTAKAWIGDAQKVMPRPVTVVGGFFHHLTIRMLEVLRAIAMFPLEQSTALVYDIAL